ncbi:hypothetical protein GQ42DRAFT_26812 [Ramicandelaber brevisporus]|nr:hypothetical protein GQ42DRAFT_26812 [Ramicandelaber brevisporus]
MMTNDYGEQPDELEQQQPTLPLLYLPIELAEEISMYFERRDAAKLLRVSRSFHSLFLPRVWVDLRTFTAIEDDEVKQHLLEKYGRFVRIIDLTYYVTSLFEFDRLSSVKRATCLKDSIHEDTTAGEAEMLIKLIKQSKMLQKLEFRFSKYDTPVKLDELASAINGLEYLKRIKIEFTTVYGAKNTENEWRHAAGFVDLLHPSKRSKLRLEMVFSTALNEAIVRTVSPYIVKLDAYGKGFCTTYLADAFFDIRDNDGQPLMFPQLKELEMTSCCFNRENYGIESIKASRFPQLQRLYFRTYSCDFERFGRPNEIEHEKRNWKPEYSSYAHIVVSSQRWQCLTFLHICIVSSSILMDIIDLNP